MKKQIREELDRICPLLPQELPEGVAEKVRKRGFLSKSALVYSIGYYADPMCDGRRTKAVKVKCSECGDETYLEYMPIERGCHGYGPVDRYGFRDVSSGEMVYTGKRATCPSCFRYCEAVGAARIGNSASYQIDYDNVVTVHNVGGHLCVLAWRVNKCVTKAAKVVYGGQKMQGISVIGNTCVRFAGCQHNYSNAVSFFLRWQPRYTWEDKIDRFDRMHIFFDDGVNTVESTDAAHSALFEYIDTATESYPSHYLRTWCKYPQIENLVRQGCQKLVTDVLENSVTHYGWYVQKGKLDLSRVSTYIATEEVKPHRMLGLEKTEMDIARNNLYKAVDFYRDIKREYGIRLSQELLDTVMKAGYHDVRELLRRFSLPVESMLNYLCKQLGKEYSIRIDGKYFMDYLDAVKQLYGNIPISMRFPANLRKAHDEAIKAVAEKQDQIVNEGIIRRAKELEALCFKDERANLLIRPCSDQAELILEGKTLDHCVARYGTDISRGKTSIFFIRTISAPDVPYYTLEYRDGGIAQNRGYKNEDPCEEVVIFANKWLQFVNMLKTKQQQTKNA